jgi:hypothetical protein
LSVLAPTLIAVILFSATLRAATPLSAEEIMRRSVAVNERDFQAEPSFSHQDHEIETKDGATTDRTYESVMMEGTPYARLIAENGRPLSPQRQREEQQKEVRERERRRSESFGDRERRIQKYREDREHDHLLMAQMAVAFTFHLAGEEIVAGHPAYVLIATPKPGYRPVNRQAKVLIGMQGKLWIDKEQFHWAKVEAEVIRPVTFAGFLARVGPGTRFELEKEPVAGTAVWQPQRFEVHVAASVLFWQRNSTTVDTFSDYRACDPASTSSFRFIKSSRSRNETMASS